MRRSGPALAAVSAGVLVAVLLGVVAVASRDGREGRPAGKLIVTRSADSLAPGNAPAHWLPPEDWVYNHWLPFDETRLYSMLGITRHDLWQQLRDDRRTVAQLAGERGWPDPKRLAAALVAPERPRVGAARAKVLEDRAERVITQGHLAQHVFFHSLHQFAIPSAAPELFGVSDMRFRALRRAERSPMSIARLHGRSPGRVEALAIAVLRERASAGVREGSTSAQQAQRLLRRQLVQLPRWLDQARYNGPPPTTRGALVELPKDYASNPAISADGRYVAYESYRQRVPLAVRFGEIAVMRADARTGRNELVSRLGDGKPVSNYNPSISGDGRRVAYETSAGNQNFAKRYGRISVLLTDMGSDRTRPVSGGGLRQAETPSDYNPVLSANGRYEAFQAVRGGRTAIVVRDLRSGRERLAARGAPVGRRTFADVYEPSLSADGTRLLYTLAFGEVADPRSATSEVRLRDLRTGRTSVVGRAGGRGSRASGGYTADGALSPDGGWAAFTIGSADGRRSSLAVHEVATGRTRKVPTGRARVLDPVVSRGGRVVAYTSLRAAGAQVAAWTRATGRTELVSRASGLGRGRAADADAGDPSISGDGRRVAFASAATNLAPGKADDARAVFLRDMGTGTTRVVSDPTAAYPRGALARAKAQAAKAGGPPKAAPVSDARPPALDAGQVAITDNAFFAGTQRPKVRIRVGERLTWLWRSRQSHAVSVSAGPERFGTAARNKSRFTHRFRRPGTYDLVCRLHAPGMRMTVVVD